MSITISTDIIRFVNIDEEPEQCALFQIQNITTKPQRVRCSVPKVSCFTLEFENLPSLAPGMTQTSYLYFKKGEDAQEYVDSITVSVGQEKYGIRLEALAKYGELRVSQ